jgi:hypothetical protein
MYLFVDLELFGLLHPCGVVIQFGIKCECLISRKESKALATATINCRELLYACVVSFCYVF